jgi:uncharacterized protein
MTQMENTEDHRDAIAIQVRQPVRFEKSELQRRRHLRYRHTSICRPVCTLASDRYRSCELRWQTLRIVVGYLIVLKAHTARETTEDGQPVEIIPIISARAADRKERHRYEQGSR